MSDGDGPPPLRSDTPLERPEHDRLGYATFAEELATTVATKTPARGYTVGIYGPWGSGKSTILNFVEEALDATETPPVVVRFNPWWFSGEADLIEKFLDQLGQALEDEDNLPDVRSKLATMASHLSSVPFSKYTGAPVEQVAQTAHDVLREESSSLDEVKADISSELADAQRNVVVMVDDIGRLTPAEISTMFQLVKSLADFPNLTYLLALDRSAVIHALEEEQNIRDGEEYLQKIVQLPLHIPVQREGALRSLFEDQLSQLERNYLLDEDRWDSLIRTGVLNIVTTPREVTRLANTVEVMHTALGDEVNLTDLVGLETLRVFHEGVYEAVKAQPSRFLGYRGTTERGDPDDYGDILDPIEDPDEQSTEGSDERSGVEAILKTLFPKVRDSLGNRYSSHPNWGQKKVEKRICHRERFPVYFRLDIPAGKISEAEMGAILSIIDDRAAFTDKLRDLMTEDGLNERSKASQFVARLTDRVNELDPHSCDPAIRSLFAIGEDLIRQAPVNQRGQVRSDLILAVGQLLERQEESQRTATLHDAIQESASPYFASEWIVAALREHGKYGAEALAEEERVLTLEEIEALKIPVSDTIQQASKNGVLLSVPWLQRPLELWTEWGDSTDTQQWVEDVSADDDGLLEFLDAMSSTFVLSQRTPVSKLDPGWLKPYLDLNTVDSRLSDIMDVGVGEGGQEIIARYRYGCALLTDGYDPSESEFWF